MGFVSLVCPTCRGNRRFLMMDGVTEISCIPCNGTGSVLVHTGSISGTRATRVVLDDPWSKVWEQLDLFGDTDVSIQEATPSTE